MHLKPVWASPQLPGLSRLPPGTKTFSHLQQTAKVNDSNESEMASGNVGFGEAAQHPGSGRREPKKSQQIRKDKARSREAADNSLVVCLP